MPELKYRTDNKVKIGLAGGKELPAKTVSVYSIDDFLTQWKNDIYQIEMHPYQKDKYSDMDHRRSCQVLQETNCLQ